MFINSLNFTQSQYQKYQQTQDQQLNIMDISEQYDVKEIIGHGSSCTVRRAIKKDIQQQFAIKVYENQRRRAKNQFDLLLRVDHPNIVNIYDVIEDQENIILVLEYMKGGELYNTIGNRTKFSEVEVREFMKAVVDAVRYCHQLKIVHRDIKVIYTKNKPQNLLMTSKGPDAIVKLADFGISKILSEQMLNTNCGTPVYMAPEIWEQKPYDQKVDIWSLGVVMYYLLTGYHPFDGDNDELVTNIKNSPLTFPEQMWNTISSKAIDLIRMLLNKDPQKRPTAKQVGNHLWLNHIDSIPRNSFLAEEVNLTKAVHKIKRFIVKERLKKNTRMLQEILNKRSKISKYRMKFLLMEGESGMSMTTEEENHGMDIETIQEN